MSDADVSFYLIYGVVAITGSVVVAGVFIVLRSLVLWYWGITEHLANQKRIIELLERIAPPQPALPPRPATNPINKAPNAR